MNQGYQAKNEIRSYLKFLDSNNGRLQQKFLYQALTPLLPQRPKAAILDAACGPGWLLAALSPLYQNLTGFDASPDLVALAKKMAPRANLQIADVTHGLPFAPQSFDCAVLNMAAPDIHDLKTAFKNLSLVLKPSSSLILTVPNPELTYPKAVWKRGFLGKLTGGMPELKLTGKTPETGKKIMREFGEGQIASFYYSLQDYADAGVAAGFLQKKLVEIRSETDSPDFDLTYQLYRYPLLLCLVFEKPF